jgi:hypothetical protein
MRRHSLSLSKPWSTSRTAELRRAIVRNDPARETPVGGSDGDQYRKAEIDSCFGRHSIRLAARRSRAAHGREGHRNALYNEELVSAAPPSAGMSFRRGSAAEVLGCRGGPDGYHFARDWGSFGGCRLTYARHKTALGPERPGSSSGRLRS